MSYKKILKIILLSFLFVGISYAVYNELKLKKQTVNENKSSNILNGNIIYYFHTTARCYSCKLIENYILDAINDNYKNELENNTLVWQSINVDETINKHYIDLFKLYSKSIVLAKYENGNLKSFINLEKVWQLLRDENAFKNYIKSEINNFIR